MTDIADYFGADDLSPLQKAQAFEQMNDAREAAAERRGQAEREAAREQRLENLHFANRQAGDPLSQIQRARTAHADADDECRDLSAKLAKAEYKRDRAARNIEFFASRMQEANQLATRSASTDLLSPAKEALAEAARQRVDAMLAAGSVTRPKEVSRGGDAVRSDQPIECPECQEAGIEDWQTSVLIHKQAEMDGVNLGQRSGHGRQPMIYRTR